MDNIRGIELKSKLETLEAVIGVIGLGYVGLPLAALCAKAGYSTIGFDIDASKTKLLNEGQSYIDAVKSKTMKNIVGDGTFQATNDFLKLSRCDVIVICVPTPLSKQREPDLSYVRQTAEVIRANMRVGQMVVLESTTYPGTTEEVLKPILSAGGMRSGEDFWLGFSPEREDPGNRDFHTQTIPKIVAGGGADALVLMQAFYSKVVEKVVPVSSLAVAEAVKISENVFRAVNIALVNELKVIYDAMGIDVWEVISAASTKPFGYMPFYPGPGLGGHCIPIDPFYLTWKAREYGISTRFIELAGEINVSMPSYVIAKLETALDTQLGKSLSKSKILIIGLAYKKNVSDVRESPALHIMETLYNRNAVVDFHDLHVQEIPDTREFKSLEGMQSIDLNSETVSSYDAVVILTDHDQVDYSLLVDHSKLIVDTRNSIRNRGLIKDPLFQA